METLRHVVVGQLLLIMTLREEKKRVLLECTIHRNLKPNEKKQIRCLNVPPKRKMRSPTQSILPATHRVVLDSR